jgi:hypothetical protein
MTMEDFQLTPGWWVLNENTVRGEPPRTDKQLLALYKNADSLRKRTHYILLKHCVVTPFGYFLSDKSRETFEAEIAECQEEAEAYNQLVGDEFKCLINFIYVRTVPNDPLYRRRMAEFAIERLSGWEERLRTMDPSKNEKALQYTQDRTKKIDLCYQGIYALAIRKAIEKGQELVSEIRKSPSIQQDLDFTVIETAKALLEKAIETL